MMLLGEKGMGEMTCQNTGQEALEYYPCRYDGSRVLFRGPRRRLDGSYVAFLGSTETYGRFVERPFPALLERRLSMESANFGLLNAGLDLYLNQPGIVQLAERAQAKVVQVMGAQNMSNRYYSVHPRRNDRFLRASPQLEALFPEVDFTEFHFNRHLLSHLEALSPERFAVVVTELKMAWVARMKHLLTLLRGRVVLLWFARKKPPFGKAMASAGDPLFVDRDMIETLRPRVSAIVEVVESDDAAAEGTAGMVFSDYDTCAAEECLGVRAHEEAADALEPVLLPFAKTS